MLKPRSWTLAVKVAGLSLLSAACTPVGVPPPVVEKTPAAASRVAGWYVQDAAAGRLELCNTPDVLTVVSGDELRKRAVDFGLQDGDPIYVRLDGTRAGPSFRVTHVEQFGSPVPITNCRMSGTIIQH